MFDYRDLFQWERFITPSIIKIFYWLAVGISVLFGLSGIVSGLTLMALSKCNVRRVGKGARGGIVRQLERGRRAHALH